MEWKSLYRSTKRRLRFVKNWLLFHLFKRSQHPWTVYLREKAKFSYKKTSLKTVSVKHQAIVDERCSLYHLELFVNDDELSLKEPIKAFVNGYVLELEAYEVATGHHYIRWPQSVVPSYRVDLDLRLRLTGQHLLTISYVDHTLAEQHFIHSHTLQQQKFSERSRAHQYFERQMKNTIIDIIVPVYNRYEEAEACIDSILSSANQTLYRLIIIDDASEDVRIRPWLANLSEPNILIVQNDKNEGYAVSCNKGMKFSRLNDVLLLNSDTVVQGNFLDRLKQAAYSSYTIGTVSPLSNNASILSFPVFCENNDLPEGMSVKALDELFLQHFSGETVDIPTSHGFCMFIKRDALDETGLFNETLFREGYAEENDFCMRAAQLGWKHVAASDVFVFHHGHLSFGASYAEKLSKSLAKLNIIYPYYDYMIHHFMVRDPLTDLRNKAIGKIAQLSPSPRQQLLMITHPLEGGTQRHVADLTFRLNHENVDVYVLSPTSSKGFRLKALTSGLVYSYREDQESLLVSKLQSLNFLHIHIQHLLGFDYPIFRIVDSLQLAFDITLHDYFPLCPRVTMMNRQYEYCNTRSDEDCNNCLDVNQPHPSNRFQFAVDRGIVAWRQAWRQVLEKARKVYVPSKDCYERYRLFLPLANMVVLPHPDDFYPKFKPKASKIIRVAVPGAISRVKGLNVLVDCARYVTKAKLPVQFVVIGFTANDSLLEPFSCIRVLGAYEREHLSTLYKEADCQVALFLSRWPETYSYTLSEAASAGLPALAFDIGAIAERIKAFNLGKVMPLDTSPASICHKLLAFGEEDMPVIKGGHNVYPSLLDDYYQLPSIGIDSDTQCSLSTLSR